MQIKKKCRDDEEEKFAGLQDKWWCCPLEEETYNATLEG
jgi:hypothetical protein